MKSWIDETSISGEGKCNWSVAVKYSRAVFGICLQNIVVRCQAFCESLPQDETYDLVIVGGGIVGLATARETALRHPSMRIALLERESKVAMHQTGLNSGVMHMGLYYKPGSLRAKLCVEGGELMYKYLDQKGIPYNKCGKVIVALDEEEVSTLKKIYATACTNKCKDIRLISAEELRKIEPHCRGVMAIHSPNTGVVDFQVVARSLGEDFKSLGGTIITRFQVNSFKTVGENNDEIHVRSADERVIKARHVITCCGLYSDKVAHFSGCKSDPRIVPIYGEYLVLSKNKSHLVNGNIYPVPNPKVPFLGVHFTPRMDGSIWCGPNTMLALSKDKYFRISWQDMKELLMFTGFRKLIFHHWRFGSTALYRRIVMRAQLKLLQKYIPEIEISDLSRGPSGVASIGIDCDGNLVRDFVFEYGSGAMKGRMLHVRNAPSPAATSAMAIAQYIADQALTSFSWNK